MKPDEFMSTIYLGDRACKSISIDSWSGIIKIGIDCISRVRGENWNFYTDEDIYDGFLVFSGVKSLAITPPDCLLDSYIEPVSIKPHGDSYKFVFSIGATGLLGNVLCAELVIYADLLCLEDKDGNSIAD